MARRPCVGCGALISGGSRCGRCRRRVGGTESRRRRAVVDAWIVVNGTVCPGYDVPSHVSDDLTADHIVAWGAGGSEAGPLTVLCRSCNARKQTGRSRHSWV